MLDLFHIEKPVLGTVQLLPLPGSPSWGGRLQDVIARAEQEAMAYTSAGVAGLIIENTYDIPYSLDRLDPAGAVAMGLIIQHLKGLTSLPIGISVLSNDPQTALAIGLNVNAGFIRVPVLVGCAVNEAGLLTAKLQELKRYQQQLKMTDSIQVLADVSLNHLISGGQPSQSSVSATDYLKRVANAIAQTQFANALIFSEKEITQDALNQLKADLPLPVLIGERMNPTEALQYYNSADGMILGKGIQKSPIVGLNPYTSVDPTQLETIMSQLSPQASLVAWQTIPSALQL